MKKNPTNEFTPVRLSAREAFRSSFCEGGFFNLRVSIGFSVGVAGVFLGLLGFGMFSAITAGVAQGQQKQKILGAIDVVGLPPGFDCSTIQEKGIDKQDNMRAGLIMIACGLSQG